MSMTRRLVITTLKWRKDQTTASIEDKKGEVEVEASSAIKEARNFYPHMLRYRAAIAVLRSFS